MKNDHEKDSVQKILEAATTEFAEVGFAGARVDTIARRAGVNKAAIYYHIGGKRELYESVVNAIATGIRDRALDGLQPDAPPEENLRRYIRNLAQAIDDNPSVAPIVLREMASKGENLSEGFFEALLNLFLTLTRILDKGAEQGVFVKTVPLLVHFMTIGPLLLFKIRGTLLAENAVLAEILRLFDSQSPTALAGQHVRDLLSDLEGRPNGQPPHHLADELETLIMKAVMRDARETT